LPGPKTDEIVNAAGALMGLQPYLILSAVVFCIGLFGVTTRRNTIGILLGIELMMNAVNINLIAFARYTASVSGMVFTVFTICITVTEAALGLAIVILLFRVRRTVMADHLDLLKG
jgi:NADH-quinone oxidoreductase subunit K